MSPQSVTSPPSRHKAQFGPESVPKPSTDLADLVSHFAQCGRPIWRLGTVALSAHESRKLVVPRLEGMTIAYDSPGQWNGVLLPPARKVLRPQLAAALLVAASVPARAPTFLADLRAQDYTQWRDVGAAALYDVVGLDHEALCDPCGLENKEKVVAACRRGRELLSALGAWPWTCFGPSGRPPNPRAWRRGVTPPIMARIFRAWANGTRLDLW
jgi:hypothetical protein